jgi:hypothetical protein
MAIQTYGIDTDDIKAQVTNLRINSASSPSTAQVTENISLVCSQVQQEAAAVGIITTGLTAGDADYEVLKKACIYKITGELVIAKNRGDADSGKYYIERYDKLMDSVRRRPDRIKVDEVGPDLATFVDEIHDSTISCVGPLFCNTIPGRIIVGNSL